MLAVKEIGLLFAQVDDHSRASGMAFGNVGDDEVADRAAGVEEK